jgi:hypothetical protein
VQGLEVVLRLLIGLGAEGVEELVLLLDAEQG